MTAFKQLLLENENPLYGDLRYRSNDHLGSVRQVVSSSGSVTDSFTTDEYGNPTASSGSSQRLHHTFVGALGVWNESGTPGTTTSIGAPTGAPVSSLGLYLMGQRYYSPSLGRFLSRDPIGFRGGLNLYGYAKANPVGWADASGLIPIRIWITGPYSEDLGPLVKNKLQAQFGPDITVALGTAPSNDPVEGRQTVWNVQITIKLTPGRLNSAGESFTKDMIELYIPGVKENYGKDVNKGPCPQEDLIKGLFNSAIHELGHEFGQGDSPKGTLDYMDPDRNHFVAPQNYDDYLSNNIKSVLKWDGTNRTDKYPFWVLPKDPKSREG